MDEKIIASVERGWGEASMHWRVGPLVDHIEETRIIQERVVNYEKSSLRIGEVIDKVGDVLAYRGYKNNQLVFTIFAGPDVTVTYKTK